MGGDSPPNVALLHSGEDNSEEQYLIESAQLSVGSKHQSQQQQQQHHHQQPIESSVNRTNHSGPTAPPSYLYLTQTQPNPFAQLTLADYQAQQQQQQQQQRIQPLNVPPPFSSTTYAEFNQQQQQQGERQIPRRPAPPPPPIGYQQPISANESNTSHQFSSSTLPRSMTIMEDHHDDIGTPKSSGPPHVAEVYQPKQHPTHKYWTLPRSIATGIPLPNGGPYAYNNGGQGASVEQGEDEVDRFNQHHEQLQQTRLKEVTEQRMKAIKSATTTSTSANSVQEEISAGTATVTASQKQILQHVVARDQPPEGATLLYETEDATFYTVPVEMDQEDKIEGMQETSSTTIRTTTYAVPKKKIDDGIGPINESGVPITPKAVCYILFHFLFILLIYIKIIRFYIYILAHIEWFCYLIHIQQSFHYRIQLNLFPFSYRQSI